MEPRFLPEIMRSIASNGWLGLHLFFVISGYCITARLAQAFTRREPLRAFLLDRWQRLFPSYWAAIGFLLLLELAAGLAHPAKIFALPQGSLHWLQILTATEVWAGRPAYLLVAWTLSYEIGFYLLGAICAAFSRYTRQARAGFILAGALLLVGLVKPIAAAIPLLALWPQFCLGGLVWLLQARVPGTGRLILIGGLLITLLSMALYLAHPWHATSHLCSGAFALLLILLLPLDKLLSGMASLRWLGAVGVISYSLYLVHAPIVGKFRNLLQRWWSPDEPAAVWVPVAGAFLAVGASAIFYRMVESRSESWRRSRSLERRLIQRA